MNEQQKRLTEIAIDVFQWLGERVSMFRRVGEVEAMDDVSDADKRELREAATKSGELFKQVADLSDSQPTTNDLIEQLIASHDRLREELATVNQKLDGIVTSRNP